MKDRAERTEERAEARENERLASEVRKDFERRRDERRRQEAQWTLNACFLAGKQFAEITPVMDVAEVPPDYSWQERQVYNHIAPIVETRLAKLASVRPVMSVRPASASDADLKIADASTKILSAVTARLETSDVISRATLWSEVTGSAFYKVTWEGGANGDVSVTAVPPYEIYPDSLYAAGLDEVRSIIHARALPVSDIEDAYGVTVATEEVELAAPERSPLADNMPFTPVRAKRDDCALLIERYERPTASRPDGRLVIVAGGEVLHDGPLPYVNGLDGSRTFPFVKQDAVTVPGTFFGSSMIERAIPVQRAYNAVKNRKHEFINRICCGVMAVEDGAVDTDLLESEGLRPGSLVVYRQGSREPHMLDQGNVPSVFASEEAKLEEEFNVITGVSDIMRSSAVPTNASSGTAIQLLIDQDDTRLTITADAIRAAVREVSKMVLRLYKQFAATRRLTRCVGEDGKVELIEWKGSDIGECDVVYDTAAETANSRAGKQSRLIELLNLGLLADEDGRLSAGTRHKLLSVFGYGSWETAAELQTLHAEKADRENLEALRGGLGEADEIDSHDIHIRSHVRFMLSAEFGEKAKRNGKLKEEMLAHIRSHKTMAALTRAAEEGGSHASTQNDQAGA